MEKEDKAKLLKAVVYMDVKMNKFDELFMDAMSEYMGSELWAFRAALFDAIGFPKDTYHTLGYDHPDSFCDDGLHNFLDEVVEIAQTMELNLDDNDRFEVVEDFWFDKLQELEEML